MDRSTLLLLASLGLLVVAEVPLRQAAMGRYLAAQTYEDVYYLPSPEALQALSFGYRRALADLIWARALVYVGEEFRHRGALDNVFRYADAILALDPDFKRVYSWIGTVGIYRPVPPTVEQGLRTVGYLERAVERFPDDGELVWDLAATLAYELPSLTDDPALKENFRERGAELMVRAAEMGAGPPWLALTNATQLERLGRTEQAIRHLEQIYPLADTETQQEILARLQALRASAQAEQLRYLEEDLERRRMRLFPFVPMSLFVLVGEPWDHEEAALRWFLPDDELR